MKGKTCSRKTPQRRLGTQLGVYIEAAQDRQLDKLIEATGRRKRDLVSEALQLMFTEYRRMGVLE